MDSRVQIVCLAVLFAQHGRFLMGESPKCA